MLRCRLFATPLQLRFANASQMKDTIINIAQNIVRNYPCLWL